MKPAGPQLSVRAQRILRLLEAETTDGFPFTASYTVTGLCEVLHDDGDVADTRAAVDELHDGGYIEARDVRLTPERHTASLVSVPDLMAAARASYPRTQLPEVAVLRVVGRQVAGNVAAALAAHPEHTVTCLLVALTQSAPDPTMSAALVRWREDGTLAAAGHLLASLIVSTVTGAPRPTPELVTFVDGVLA